MLPLSEPPKSGRLAGPVLQQARVLGAAPPALRPYVDGSYYGESGVDVELTSGIELRFGDASQAAQKWKAAAAVLADPSITALDYVDLHAPAARLGGGTLPPPDRWRAAPAAIRLPAPMSPKPSTCRVRVAQTLKSSIESSALQDASRRFDRGADNALR